MYSTGILKYFQGTWEDSLEKEILCASFIRKYFKVNSKDRIIVHISENRMKESVPVYLIYLKEWFGDLMWSTNGVNNYGHMFPELEEGLLRKFKGKLKTGKPFKV